MTYYLVELEDWQDAEQLGIMDYDGFHQVKAKADVTDNVTERLTKGTWEPTGRFALHGECKLS